MRQLVPTTLILSLALAGCAFKKEAPTFAGADLPPDVAGNTAPSAQTTALNASVGGSLPLADQQDFEDAKRGLIASDPELLVAGPEGNAIWDMPSYAFIDGDAPASVNPSLWRQARLNNIHGLFEVT
ncbi:MAG: MBL fold metallo-hydrolase, partial [Deltaproteobacteria bacterium]|nr:MBL fold metallo-hydrolase [Deltaproteobacteria bacterium]